MDFLVATGDLQRQRTGCIVAGVYQGRKLSPAALALDLASGHAIQTMLDRGDLEGALGATLLLHDLPNLAAERVLLVGLGGEREFRESSYRAALSSTIRTLRTTGAADATICLHELPVDRRDTAWKVEQAVLVAMEGMYRFDRLKSKPPEAAPALTKLVFHVADPDQAAAADAAIVRASAIAEGVVVAKDLGNLPGNLCTPTYLAEQARDLGERHGFGVTILEQREMEKLGMGGLLAVARGSCQPPKLLVMESRGHVRWPKRYRNEFGQLIDCLLYTSPSPRD